MVYKKKKVGRNCRVFLRVSCLMRTILPERQPHLLPDLAPLWRYGVGSLPLSLATKDPSSSLTPVVVSFHSRLPAQAHVHWQVEVKQNTQEVSEVKESQWLYSRRSEAQTKSVRVEDGARMAAQKSPAGYGPLRSGGYQLNNQGHHPSQWSCTCKTENPAGVGPWQDWVDPPWPRENQHPNFSTTTAPLCCYLI